jgi:hypothetical protein
MRETRQSGSVGGAAQTNAPSLPQSGDLNEDRRWKMEDRSLKGIRARSLLSSIFYALSSHTPLILVVFVWVGRSEKRGRGRDAPGVGQDALLGPRDARPTH